MRKQKLYGDDSCPSQLQSLAEDLQLAGVEGQTDGKLRSSGKGGTDLPVYVCVAPSMIVGAWLMAVVLWQHYEYYYYNAGGMEGEIWTCTFYTCR